MGSGGGGSQNYPAAAIGGLFQAENQAFPLNAYGGANTSVAGQNAFNASNSLPTAQGQNLINAGQANLPYANQALQTGFDPQNALFAKLFQQQQDQSNVVNAQNGVAGTPYGAGLVNQNNQNFDINWQNQQLGRQAQGAQTANSILGGAGNALQAGQSPTQNTIQDLLAYLQGATGNASALYGAQNNSFNAGTGLYSASNAASLGQQQQNSSELSGLGSLGGTLLGLFA